MEYMAILNVMGCAGSLLRRYSWYGKEHDKVCQYLAFLKGVEGGNSGLLHLTAR